MEFAAFVRNCELICTRRQVREMETTVDSCGLRKVSHRPAQMNDSVRCGLIGPVANEARPLGSGGLSMRKKWRCQPEGKDDKNSRDYADTRHAFSIGVRISEP